MNCKKGAIESPTESILAQDNIGAPSNSELGQSKIERHLQ
jgi:hypothetical protein